MLRQAVGDGREIGRHPLVVGRAEHDIGGARESDQFGQGECRLGGSAPGGDHHFAERRTAKRRQCTIGDVGAGQVVGIRREHTGHIQRDVSIADDHHPLVAEIDWQIGRVGMPIDPRDQFGGGSGARQVHAVDLQATVVGGTDGVQHRVMVGQQIGVTQVLADVDVEVEPEAAMTGNSVEQPGDPFGVLVIGRHPRAHQPVGGGQLLKDVDPHAMLGEQFVGGIHRRRPGPHDGHGQRPAAGPYLGGRNHRGQLRRRRQLLTLGRPRVEGGVDLDERQLLGIQPGVRRDRADGAGAHARATVHAGHRIDVEHLRGGEAGLIGRGVNAIHRACENAGPVVAA